MNINEITTGMTPQEKDIYFAHQEKRHREEAEIADKKRMQRYNNKPINYIDLTNKYLELGKQVAKEYGTRKRSATQI